jgi:3-carboxy-cis,cis-muconate cycloisomerase
VMPGRTHAQPAVPITLGGKIAVWLSELARHVERLRSARARLAIVQLFGAAGTAAALGPRSRDVRHAVAERLGLGVVDVPWHTARDGVAEAGFALAALAGLCARLAREVVELSRPEIGELREEGGHQRGASSTMPQKANPIGSEAVIGMSVLAAHHAGALLAALQGTHERSAGEWQVEWDAVPAVFAAAGGAVAGAARVVEGLRVFPERMRANLELDGGTIMAEAAMMAVGEVLGRAEAHAAVYEASALARSENVSLAEAMRTTLAHDVLAALPPLDEVLAPDAYLGETDAIVTAACESWARVMSSPPAAGTARP